MLELSVVVRAAEVYVDGGHDVVGGRLLVQCMLIEASLKDRPHALVAERAEGKRAAAGRINPLAAGFSDEAKDAFAGFEGELWMRTAGKKLFDQLGGRRTDPLGAAPVALRRARRPVAVMLRHVSRSGRLAALHEAPRMRRLPGAFVEDLHRGAGCAHVELLAAELVRCGVVVSVDLHMVVAPEQLAAPLGELIRLRRERTQRRTLNLLEERAPRAGQLLERTMVVHLQKPADLPVQIR